ncbi:hypothetical protein GCM10010271_37800 [Streptomyces kurssanovii]|nr:hypothetical protein GCM10010271_37800 [Streptomyces kurssanovii]
MLRGARDLLMRSRTFQRAVRAGTVRGHVPLTVWRHLHPTGVHAPDGSTFHDGCGPDDVLAGPVVWTDLRLWEEAPIRSSTGSRAPRAGSLDAGAYTGLYTLLACQANPRLHAVAVEGRCTRRGARHAAPPRSQSEAIRDLSGAPAVREPCKNGAVLDASRSSRPHPGAELKESMTRTAIGASR